MKRSPEWLWVALLLLIVTLTWCGHYNRWTGESWQNAPLTITDERWVRWKAAFGGDALWGMAATKAMADGEIGFFTKSPPSFGAPFVANWNDWLTAEEGFAVGWALLVRLFGLFPGSNLALLSSHLLAALSFYAVCRYFRYDRALAVAGAALFALSRYAFWRGLPHLGLVIYWHIPLGFLVVWWCFRGEEILRNNRKLLFSLGVAILYGVQSPYYAAMFLQLLFCATGCAFLRAWDWRKVLPTVFITGTFVATFVLMTVDTFYHKLTQGPNVGIAGRSYPDVELWSLKPVELFLPVSHSLKVIEKWANDAYFNRSLLLGEGGSPYLGVIAIGSLGWLLWIVAKACARQDFRQIPLHFWCVLWIFAYSSVGGVTAILGLWDIFLVRATNRMSMFVLAVALLFLVKQLSLGTRAWRTTSVFGLSALLIGVGIFDQVPPRNPAAEKATREMFAADKKLVAEIEAKLPKGAMIFQLPIMEFPEGYAIEKMIDYEPFRPYLHSEHLRFSYGDNRGRHRDRWQREADRLGADGLVRKLERHGFSAILVNSKGYADPKSPIESLRAVGRGRILARSPDYVCIKLNPSRRLRLPPEFGNGWYSLEGSYYQNTRWSSGDATLVLHNPEQRSRTTRLRFELTAFTYRYVEIWADNQIVYHGVVSADATPISLRIKLKPGANEVRFTTDRPGEIPPNGDPRHLAFAVLDFRSSR